MGRGRRKREEEGGERSGKRCPVYEGVLNSGVSL